MGYGPLGLASQTHHHPHDESVWVELRTKLSNHRKQKAAKAVALARAAAIGQMVTDLGEEATDTFLRILGTKQTAQQLAESGAVEVAEESEGEAVAVQPQQPEDDEVVPYRGGYDLDVASAEAAKGWSFAAPPTVANIRDLDDVTRRWLHGLVWEELLKPPPKTVTEGNSSRPTAT